MKTKTNCHYTHGYLLNPMHSVTVSLVGVGGTGSRMLTNLAMIDQALVALGHPGLLVTAIDPDKVSPSNIGRQQFSPADIGDYKADVLISRVNRFYGLDWEAHCELYTANSINSNIIISCVDNINTRKVIHERKPQTYQQHMNECFYWMDMGNGKDYGQVILSTKKEIRNKNKNHVPVLKGPFEYFPNLSAKKESNEPSCSLPEALLKQDLFINPMIALQASDLLWKMFTQPIMEYHGVFVNMKTLQITKLKI